MLTFWDRCPHNGRRAFLRAGSLGGLAGLNQQFVSAVENSSAAAVRDRAVIFLFLHGGPSQTETFDPKMTAPVGVQSVDGEVQTCLPGVSFGASFPGLLLLLTRSRS